MSGVITLKEMKKMVKVDEQTCINYREKYFNCKDKYSDNYKKCMKLFDLAIKCYYLLD